MVVAAARFVPPSLRVDALLVADDGIAIRAGSASRDVRCPLCGESADRVQSHATRTLVDLPWAGAVVHLRVQVRKFFYANPSCPRRIFAERLDGIAQVSARRTERQQAARLDFALAPAQHGVGADRRPALRSHSCARFPAEREGERLPSWLDAAEASEIDVLARFARKRRTDLTAVQAGLTLRQSNGQTEVQVNRLKLLKLLLCSQFHLTSCSVIPSTLTILSKQPEISSLKRAARGTE